MACIEYIYSVSALVGDGDCNANCDFCAGKYLRPQAIDQEKEQTKQLLYEKNLEAAIKLSATYQGWSLSLTSSGEPTCDPDALTRALEIYDKCANQGAYLKDVNLFTNGILFGDRKFTDTYLPKWRELGLTNIAISIHDVDETKQGETYGIKDYPKLETLVENIERHGVGVRGTLLLRKGGVDNPKTYEVAVKTLINKGIVNITSWPIGNPDGSRTKDTPSRWNMFKIDRWLHRNAKLCHGHVWGGGVFDFNGTMLRLTDYVTKHNPRKDFVRQLVVFQDATVAYSWIKEGALCLK